MSKKEIKQTAQDNLMSSMQAAFCADELTNAARDEMDKQMKRVERLFGYESGSWSRGA